MAENPKIQHRLGVAAPAHVVWEVVSDIESWPSWNPIYPKAKGKLGFGEALQLTVALPDREPFDLNATVVEWVPEEQILWTTKPGAFVQTTRYIEIDKLTDTACIFSNGEMFQGMMARSAARKNGRAMYRAFEQMGEIVKARAEALWAERQAEAAK